MAELKTSELTYLFVGADETVSTIAENRICGKKYVQSILAKDIVAQTTFFDGKAFSRVEGSKIYRMFATNTLDAQRLRTYNNIQYGYKQLDYEFTRMPDEKFQNFDCFVVQARNKFGNETINYFDKTNYRLLMVIYPEGNKSLMIEYKYQGGILFNSLVINRSADGKVDKLKLLKIKTNTALSDSWFNCPYQNKVILPDSIRTGKFSPVIDNSILVRTNDMQIETDSKGGDKIELTLKWINADSFELNSIEPEGKTSMNILVRIVSWDTNGYVCQYISGQSTGTQEYRMVK